MVMVRRLLEICDGVLFEEPQPVAEDPSLTAVLLHRVDLLRPADEDRVQVRQMRLQRLPLGHGEADGRERSIQLGIARVRHTSARITRKRCLAVTAFGHRRQP